MEETYKAVVGGSKGKAKAKAGLLIALAVVVVAGIAAGSYALVHKSSNAATTSNAALPSYPTSHNDGNKSTAGSAVNNAVLNTHSYAGLGQFLTDPQGNTLYTYTKDITGVSKCTGSCLTDWPAYQATGATTGLPSGVGTITRSDNSQVQYTYQGKPLYYFAQDSTGSVTGDGVNNFKVAKPAS